MIPGAHNTPLDMGDGLILGQVFSQRARAESLEWSRPKPKKKTHRLNKR